MHKRWFPRRSMYRCQHVVFQATKQGKFLFTALVLKLLDENIIISLRSIFREKDSLWRIRIESTTYFPVHFWNFGIVPYFQYLLDVYWMSRNRILAMRRGLLFHHRMLLYTRDENTIREARIHYHIEEVWRVVGMTKKITSNLSWSSESWADHFASSFGQNPIQQQKQHCDCQSSAAFLRNTTMATEDVSNTVSDSKETKKSVDDMSLLSITDGENDRGIPVVKFIEDVDAFSNSFSPPSSAELLIGAYSELHSKFKTFETSLTQKSTSQK